MASSSPQFSFSIEEAKVALSDILDAFDSKENAQKIEEARDSAGNDMLKMMQIVFPITTQIQMNVIGKYGFPADGDGIIRFAQTIKAYEKQDQEITALNSKLRMIVMPQMAAPPPEPTAAS